MIIESTRIGRVEVKEDRVIRFENGLLGFSDLKEFILADDPVDISMPFKWLVSIANPEIIFLVTDPGIFFKDYVFDLPAEDSKALGVNTEDDVSVITMLTVPSEAKKMTANLRGPLVVNWRTLQGRQVILKDNRYTTKHYVFIQDAGENKAGSDKNATASTVANGTGSFLAAPSTSGDASKNGALAS